MRNIFLLSLLAIYFNSAAAQFLKIGEGETYTSYIHTMDVPKGYGITKFWIILDFKLPQYTTGGKQYQSARVKFEADCDIKQAKPVLGFMYAGHMTEGDIVLSDVEYKDDASEISNQILYEKVCLSKSYTPPKEAVHEEIKRVDYTDFKTVIFDGAKAKGKTIRFLASFKELGILPGELPNMFMKAVTDTGLDLWKVHFDSQFNDRVKSLRVNQRIIVTCKIGELSSMVSKCLLIDLQGQL